MEDRFTCPCGRVWHFPDEVQENRHRLYTLICDCARVYTVVHGCVTLRNKPVWPWKRARRSSGQGTLDRCGVGRPPGTRSEGNG